MTLTVFGVVLVVMMLVRPEGLFPSSRRKLEAHQAEPAETEGPQP
jgi:ABC-type branched-subunit amino acid transport system permease subunit